MCLQLMEQTLSSIIAEYYRLLKTTIYEHIAHDRL